jgi:hypothetical protein
MFIAGQFPPGADRRSPFLPLEPTDRIGGNRTERGDGPGRRMAGDVLADPGLAGIHQDRDLGDVRLAAGVGDGGDLRGPRSGRQRDRRAEAAAEAGVEDGGDVAGSG